VSFFVGQVSNLPKRAAGFIPAVVLRAKHRGINPAARQIMQVGNLPHKNNSFEQSSTGVPVLSGLLKPSFVTFDS